MPWLVNSRPPCLTLFLIGNAERRGVSWNAEKLKRKRQKIYNREKSYFIPKMGLSTPSGEAIKTFLLHLYDETCCSAGLCRVERDKQNDNAHSSDTLCV
jgi:hypothetical protein